MPCISVNCRGCGEKTVLHGQFKYCRDCVYLRTRLKNEHIPIKGRKKFWACMRKRGRRCRLSGVSLQIHDYADPWYLVFSRLIPGDDNSIVPAAAVFNEMKSALMQRSFRYYVLALDDNRQKHIRVRKRPIVHWRLVGPQACPICGQSKLSRKKLCVRCSRIAHRMKVLRLSRKVVQAVWDYLRTYGFVCYYTGMELELDDPKSPWYLVFDHWMPRDPRKMVVTSALVNEMKGDLTEDEFWYFIRQLARFYREGIPVRKKALEFWSRQNVIPLK